MNMIPTKDGECLKINTNSQFRFELIVTLNREVDVPNAL